MAATDIVLKFCHAQIIPLVDTLCWPKLYFQVACLNNFPIPESNSFSRYSLPGDHGLCKETEQMTYQYIVPLLPVCHLPKHELYVHIGDNISGFLKYCFTAYYISIS